MKKLIFTILIILLCLTSFMLVSCDEEEDTTTVKPPEFSITYELNGGTNSVDNPLTYKKGDVVTLNNPTKDNYYFKGWYTDASFTNKITEIKDKSENITLYAKWVPVVTYNISYELNGGTNNTENPKTYKTGDTVSLAFPEKADYMFAGWYTDSALTNEIKEIKDKEESLTLYAKWIPYGDIFEFEKESDGYCVVISYKQSADTVIIPSTYNGLPVTGMRTKVGGVYKTVKAVYIPKTVTTIKSSWIFNADYVNDVKLSLEYISVHPDNPSYKSVDGVLYSKDGKTLIQYPACKSGVTFTVPEDVTSIGKLAFGRCKNLKSIILPDSLINIGPIAFLRCTSLESIVVPDSVTDIGYGAFTYCTSLKSVTLSSNIEAVKFSTFSNCAALEKIVIPDGVKSIEYSAFYYCTALKSVHIPDSVTTLGIQVFNNCRSLENIVIPDSVINMGKCVFADATSVTVNCEAKEKPEGWDKDWSNDAKEVVWGYKESDK